MARAPLLLTALALVLSGCTIPGFGGDDGPDPAVYGSASGGTVIAGTITIAGSTSMQPLLEAWADDFGDARDVDFEMSHEGSTSGATALCLAQADIAAMSRQMTDDEETTCEDEGVEPLDLRVAEDAIVVVTPTANDYATDLSVDELASIFQADGFALSWDEVDPDYPPEAIRLCIPDGASGTFHVFNDHVLPEVENGTPARTGQGVQQFAGDADLLQCIADDQYAIGYVSLASYQDAGIAGVQSVAVEGVEPSQATLADGSYDELDRSLYLYTDDPPAGVLHDFLSYVYHNQGGQPFLAQLDYAALSTGSKTLNANKLG